MSKKVTDVVEKVEDTVTEIENQGEKIMSKKATDVVEKVEDTVTENKSTKDMPPPTKNVDIKNDDEVVLEALVGRLTYVAKKGYPLVRWNVKGEENSITFGEFTEMIAQQPRFVTEPWVKIKTEAVLEKFPIYKNAYKKFSSIESLGWLTSGDVVLVKNKLKKLPEDMRSKLISKATGLITSGEIESIKVIKLLEEEFNTKLLNLIV